MHEVLVNCLGGLSLPRKSVVRLTDRPDTVDIKQQCKTTTTTMKFEKAMVNEPLEPFKVYCTVMVEG